MELSIIIPTHNRCDSLRKALHSLLAQEYDGKIEIIVVIDGCADDTLNMVESEFTRVKTVVFENNVGAAKGLNAGVKIAQGKILLFLDDDMKYHSKLILEHQRMHQEEKYDVIIGHFPLGDLPVSSFFRKVIYDWTEGWQKSFPENVSFYDALCSGHFSISRNLYDKVEGFDEDFSIWGRKDSELGYRLIQAGARFGFNEKAIATQNYDKLPSDFLTDFKLLGQADVQMDTKHNEIKKTLLLSCFYQAPWMVRWLREYLFNHLSATNLFVNVLATIFDKLHALKFKGRILEGVFWTLADCYYWQGVHAALGGTKQVKKFVGNPVAILMYHQVCDKKSPFSVSPKTFEMQMRYLYENKYNVFALGDAVSMLQRNEDFLPKSVVITFDDGYKDFWNAYNILQKFNFPVTLYIPTAYIGKINSWNNEVMNSDIPLLTLEEIKQLRLKGVNIEAHGHNHKKLGGCSIKDIEDEVSLCKKTLNDINIFPKSFSYPGGDYSSDVKEMIEKCGFQSGVSCISTLASKDSDIMALPRITIEESDLDDFKMRLEYGIGATHAQREFADQLSCFRPTKWWHDAKGFDSSRIFVYQTKRQNII